MMMPIHIDSLQRTLVSSSVHGTEIRFGGGAVWNRQGAGVRVQAARATTYNAASYLRYNEFN